MSDSKTDQNDEVAVSYCGYPCETEIGRDGDNNPILCGLKCCKLVDNLHPLYGAHVCVTHRS